MSRLVLEGLQTQGPNEEIPYRIQVTPGAVSVVSVTVTDQTTRQACTETVMPGAAGAAVQDGAIVLPALKSLTIGHTYQVAVLYSDGQGSRLEPLFRVRCA
jgi:hypothetical protein